MGRVLEFEPRLESLLPTSHKILASANFIVHPRVSFITLHGSRGLAGGCRPDSDIDLSLITDIRQDAQSNLQAIQRDILEITLENWKSAVEADLAAVFDVRNCGLKCFDRTTWEKQLCSVGGVDCFGLYKIQKGFNGIVSNAGVQVKQIYPCLKIWQRPPKSESNPWL
jgi:hypothetical protein